MMWTLKITH